MLYSLRMWQYSQSLRVGGILTELAVFSQSWWYSH
uniref:Uncharacterized protein n=1 Tax=Anguilla anguilla TaxID=7936 RepID=A0A0E9REN1_ANGAN